VTDLAFLFERFGISPDDPAVVWNERVFSYSWLLDAVRDAGGELSRRAVDRGSVVRLEGDFSPRAIALLLALIDHECIILPSLRSASGPARQTMAAIAAVEYELAVDLDDSVAGFATGRRAPYDLYETLRHDRHAGLVLFSSGSSGRPKAAVHDLGRLLEKFRQRRESLRTLNFLLFDHWGGLNTLLHTLSNGGTVFTIQDRSPDAVCRLIESHRVEVLPASPTFLNLLLLSRAHSRHDLSSLKIVSYGTEPMPQSLLKRLSDELPWIRLHQTYGLIELGVLRSKSRSNDSVWVKLGGEGFETRVVDGLLQIRAKSAMLGYLNAPSPFTDDGWFMTGDAVDVDGDYFRIIGRASELINVGGEKVYPQEVESVILEIANIADVTVFGEKNSIVGNIVCARVRLLDPEEPDAVTLRVKRHCRERLPGFKVPVKVTVVHEDQHGERFKKIRGGSVS
jgi:long-chain acyl-CoA synthetase